MEGHGVVSGVWQVGAVAVLSASVALSCGCAMFAPPHVGAFGDRRNGVCAALQTQREAVERGDRIRLYAVVHNVGLEPVSVPGNPYVTIGVRINGKYEGDMVGMARFSKGAIRIAPGGRKVCLIESFGTAGKPGTWVFSGGINLFGDGGPKVTAGVLRVTVR
jgi:hypothetical protein